MIKTILEKSSGVVGHVIYVTSHAITGGILLTHGANYVDFNQAEIVYTKTNNDGQISSLVSVGTWNLIQMCAVFNLLTMSTHIWYLYQRFANALPFYSLNFRWLEYSITAPLMVVNVAILSGVRELFVLLTIAGAMSTTQYFGYLADQCYLHNWIVDITKTSPFGISTSWINLKNPFWFGCWPYMFSWLPIFAMFFITISDSEDVPGFVYGIIFFTFIIFSMFAVVQWWWVVRNTREDGYGGFMSTKSDNMELYDGAMHLLSLTSKLILSWWVYLGISNMTPDDQTPLVTNTSF
jgi:hypothetical protein